MSAESPWIPVGELSHGFEAGSYSPAPSSDLAGETLRLHLADGRSVQYAFLSERSLKRTVDPGTGAGLVCTEEYLAVRVRRDLYFVDFVLRDEQASCVSLVLDLGRGIATELTGRLPDEAEAGRSLRSRLRSGGLGLTGVRATFVGGAIDRSFDDSTELHEETSELVGKRVEYTYSPTERYEHIYLNDHFYTWHCLSGVERGLADTDRCHYRKLGDRLYLFVWREKLVPTLGVVVLDYSDWTSRGKIFGYEGGDFARLTNFAVGASARLLNAVERPAEQAGAAGGDAAAGSLAGGEL